GAAAPGGDPGRVPAGARLYPRPVRHPRRPVAHRDLQPADAAARAGGGAVRRHRLGHPGVARAPEHRRDRAGPKDHGAWAGGRARRPARHLQPLLRAVTLTSRTAAHLPVRVPTCPYRPSRSVRWHCWDLTHLRPYFSAYGRYAELSAYPSTAVPLSGPGPRPPTPGDEWSFPSGQVNGVRARRGGVPRHPLHVEPDGDPGPASSGGGSRAGERPG